MSFNLSDTEDDEEKAEHCEEDGCTMFPEFADEDGYIWCADHYDGDPEFGHIPDEGYRCELRREYKREQ